MRRLKRRTKYKNPRVPVPLRFGKGLLRRVTNDACKLGIPRNRWLTEAAVKLLNIRTRKYLSRSSAQELFSKRILIMPKMDADLVELIKEAAIEDDVTITLWLMDAALHYLGTHGSKVHLRQIEDGRVWRIHKEM